MMRPKENRKPTKERRQLFYNVAKNRTRPRVTLRRLKYPHKMTVMALRSSLIPRLGLIPLVPLVAPLVVPLMVSCGPCAASFTPPNRELLWRTNIPTGFQCLLRAFSPCHHFTIPTGHFSSWQTGVGERRDKKREQDTYIPLTEAKMIKLKTKT